MHSEVQPKFKVEFPHGDELIERIARIFRENRNPKSYDHLRWQYLANPGEGCYSAFAVSEEGKDAAVYSLFKVKAKVRGELTTVCQSLDTLTDSGFRGLGLFTVLAKAINARCDEDAVDFIYGFPNDKSGPGFFKKLGWISLGFPPFVFYAGNCLFLFSRLFRTRLILPNYFGMLYHKLSSILLRKQNGYRVRFGADFDGQYDDLWGSFSSSLDTCIWRDSKYLNWRYLQKPGADYRFASVWRGAELCGIAIYAQREKHKGQVGYVMDLIYRDGRESAGRLALTEAVLDLSRTGADVVLAWRSPFSSVGKCYRFALFAPLPRIAQPIKLFFGRRLRFGKGEIIERPKDEFFISYADSDTV